MARIKTKIDKKTLDILKSEILKKAGVELKRSVDCDKLAEIICDETKICINGITFKRLYGFTKYNFNPSIQTLNILSNYIGFDGWYDVEYYFADVQPISKNELEIYLSFYDIDPINRVYPNEGGMQSISRKIALRFRQDYKTFIRTLPEFMEKEHFRFFYAELLIDYDTLCLYSHRVYDEYLKYSDDAESDLFGWSVKFLFALWTLNQEEMELYHDKIKAIVINDKMHPFVIGRYFTTLMVFDYKYHNSENFESIYKEFLTIRSSLIKDGKQFVNFPVADYLVAETLVICEKYQECIDLIQSISKEINITKEFVIKGYYRHLQIFWIISNLKLNPKFDTKETLQKIKPDNFYFISRKYYSCFYQYACFLSTQNKKHLTKAEKIAKTMGNNFLSKEFIKY